MKNKYYSILLLTGLFFTACKKDAMQLETSPAKVDALLNLPVSMTTASVTTLGTISPDSIGFLRLQLSQDQANYDNLLISFKPTAKNIFVVGEDAPKLPGFTNVSLAALTSDNVATTINTLPLPAQSVNIGLRIGAKTDGIYTLQMLALKSIPALYDVWLMDNYKKDSLNYRDNASYAFNLSVADTNSYGSKRFSILVRENVGRKVHLLNLTAAVAAGTTQINWKTENELNYTVFAIERSTDNGQTFTGLTSFSSSFASNYSYTDQSPVKGIDTYRLKITDVNGTISYSAPFSFSF